MNTENNNDELQFRGVVGQVQPAAQPQPAEDQTTQVQAATQLQPVQNQPMQVQPASAAPQMDEDEDLEAQLAFETIKRNREARKRKRIIVAVIVALIALGVGAYFVITKTNEAQYEEEYDPLAATSMVMMGDFESTITANGATEPLASTIVSPEVDGIIENLSVAEGAYVQEGDVLFTLKNEALDKGVREANTALQSARRSVDSAAREVDQAYAAYNSAAEAFNAGVYEVVDESEEGEGGTDAEFDEASLLSAIEAAEEGYQTALDGVESAEQTLAEAQEEADKRIVRATVSGTVVAMNAQNGEAVGVSGSGSGDRSGPLVQISDLSKMKVTVQVNEADISNIEVGQEAKATFSALPDIELDAVVQRIASVATGSSYEDSYDGGVVTYAVDLLIPKPDPNLKPGMTATVTITTQSAPGVLMLPTAALSEEDEGDKASVTVVDPDTNETSYVSVTVVARDSSMAGVKPGETLKEGDLVLLDAMGGEDMSGGMDGEFAEYDEEF